MKSFIRIFSMVVFIAFTTSFSYAQYNTISDIQIGFKSTSTMPVSGSHYSSTPITNKYGMAEYSGPSYLPHRVDPYRTTMENPGTPGGGPNPQNQLPIGDCPIYPLLLFAIGYCYYEKRKTVSV